MRLRGGCSSHSATVCGLTTAALLKYGAGSFEFAVSFGLKIKKIPSAEIEKMVASALERMQIGQYAKRYPTELSGGQH